MNRSHADNPTTKLCIGAAQIDFTPDRSLYLCGYPFVKRMSTATHDPLLASAVVIDNAQQMVAFVGCDILAISKQLVAAARQRIASQTDIPAEHILISPTHTHSGPLTINITSAAADRHVTPPDPDVLRKMEDAIVEATVQAYHQRTDATLHFAQVDGSMLGTNRRDPAGPSLPQIPVLIARDATSDAPLGVLCVVTMHPTVLHEDWTQYSGDFPGLARQWLQRNIVSPDCPLVYHMGASGNQSPRHVVEHNTIEAAWAHGEKLGHQLAHAIETATALTDPRIVVARAEITLPQRNFPDLDTAAQYEREARQRLETMRQNHAPRARTRTAEVDWFGAAETYTLAKAAAEGRLREAVQACMPAEIQIIGIDEHAFVAWPCEIFVEFALQIRERYPNTHIITLANGELQGYLVTRQAMDDGAYEAGNAIFQSPDSGEQLVACTMQLLDRLR